MKTRSTEALRHLLPTSQPWERRAQITNPIRGYDSRIRLALCWTRRYPCSASSAGSHHKKSWKSAGRNTSVTIGTATTPEEGAALQAPGVDAIVASGFEARGQRGSV